MIGDRTGIVNAFGRQAAGSSTPMTAGPAGAGLGSDGLGPASAGLVRKTTFS
ncbi:MAG: hypothetical protein QUU85_12170 [Candidatus Eisenbacteria bacterium]|nr:hypothetical protein [Candidatus Eisenbacteria bacterium]